MAKALRGRTCPACNWFYKRRKRDREKRLICPACKKPLLHIGDLAFLPNEAYKAEEVVLEFERLMSREKGAIFSFPRETPRGKPTAIYMRELVFARRMVEACARFLSENGLRGRIKPKDLLFQVFWQIFDGHGVSDRYLRSIASINQCNGRVLMANLPDATRALRHKEDMENLREGKEPSPLASPSPDVEEFFDRLRRRRQALPLNFV